MNDLSLDSGVSATNRAVQVSSIKLHDLKVSDQFIIDHVRMDWQTRTFEIAHMHQHNLQRIKTGTCACPMLTMIVMKAVYTWTVRCHGT